CRKRFRATSELVCHQRLHGRGTTFGCREHGKEFGQSSDLGSRRKSHAAEKPYQRSQCQKLFKDRSTL
ncbi:ZN271 protein, partial [Alca torda]|nr:ZN271 protein [Alca torda]